MQKRYVVLNDKDSEYGDVLIFFRKRLKARITLWADGFFLDDDLVEDFRDFRQRHFDTLDELLVHLTRKWRWQKNHKGIQTLPEISFDRSNYQMNLTRRKGTAKDARPPVSEPAPRAGKPQEDTWQRP